MGWGGARGTLRPIRGVKSDGIRTDRDGRGGAAKLKGDGTPEGDAEAQAINDAVHDAATTPHGWADLMDELAMIESIFDPQPTDPLGGLPPISEWGPCLEVYGYRPGCGAPPLTQRTIPSDASIAAATDDLDLELLGGPAIFATADGFLARKFVADGNVAGVAELVGCAWAMLQANWTSLEWALCMMGLSNLADCYSSHLFDPGAVTVVVSPGDGLLHGGSEKALASTTGHTITLYSDDETYAAMIFDYENGSLADQTCACLGIAIELAHELLHTCGLFGFPDDPPQSCDESYVFENLVAWALSERYDDALSGLGRACCSHIQDAMPFDDTDLPITEGTCLHFES